MECIKKIKGLTVLLVNGYKISVCATFQIDYKQLFTTVQRSEVKNKMK